MYKEDLRKKIGISTTSVTKMVKNGHVNTETLDKICKALGCELEDIVEITQGEE